MKAETQIRPKLYHYQEEDINTLLSAIEASPKPNRILYQLPTGGGKTRVFSELTNRFLDKYDSKVVILTHRIELCSQTSQTLKRLGIRNKIINSATVGIRKSDYSCYVAMVETLKNRIRSKKINTGNVGLVIIDEAHHNSFRKLLGSFRDAIIVGVTATPFSSDITLPLRESYDALVTGANISSLIQGGFLAKPTTFTYPVELNTLKKGTHGDYTVGSSNELYSSPSMLKLLLDSYEKNSKGKKTLIFNNGIETSAKVCEMFTDAGYPIRHLDNKTKPDDRKEILKWFRKTKDAILTSVSILTTGFDEPGVKTVILNRATTSLTLYHQMIGRGSRRLPTKKTFSIIDLGNNVERFGEWSEPVDWKYVFEHPKEFAEQLQFNGGGNSAVHSHAVSAEVRAMFPNSLELTFDIEGAYIDAISNHQKPKTILQLSIRQQAQLCLENSETLTHALQLADALKPETEWRVKQYVKCLENASKNYKDWLIEDYNNRLRIFIEKVFHRLSA